MFPSTNLRRRRLAGEHGFTLIEVMVVVLIIGILLAIGVPTYLGARGRAQDKGAQSTLRSGQTTSLVIFTDDGNFSSSTTTNLATAEPSYIWVNATTASDADGTLSVAPNTAGAEWGAAVMSDSGTCFYIRLSNAGPTRYGSSTTSSCTGTQALTVTGTGW